MKPRTKHHKAMVAIQEKLPSITKEQEQYAYDNCFDNYYLVSRNRYICLECNHKWKPDGPAWHDEVTGDSKCPSCEKKLTLYKYPNGTTYSREEYFSIVTVFEGHQLIRHFLAKKFMRKKERPSYFIMECVQHFIDERGKMTTFAKLGTTGYGYMNWAYGSDIELRGVHMTDIINDRYFVNPTKIWPRVRVLPIFKRNGFRSSFYDQAPERMFLRLLFDPKFETLIKTKQFSLARMYGSKMYEMERNWSSICIAHRNGYKIKDATLWFDYLSLLDWAGKDLRNAKFICPANLKVEHDILFRRKRAIEEAERERRRAENAELQRKLLEEAKRTYADKKGHFFDLVITDGNLTITPLKSVEEFEEEGKELDHCVFVNKYYSKEFSLCLSARIDGKRTETIEVSLNDYAILQSRGYDNDPTEHHDRIVEVMNAHMKEIRKRHIAHKRTQNTKNNEVSHAA